MGIKLNPEKLLYSPESEDWEPEEGTPLSGLVKTIKPLSNPLGASETSTYFEVKKETPYWSGVTLSEVDMGLPSDLTPQSPIDPIDPKSIVIQLDKDNNIVSVSLPGFESTMEVSANTMTGEVFDAVFLKVISNIHTALFMAVFGGPAPD